MSRLFILAYDLNVGTREAILAFMDSRSEILNWMAIMPGSIIFVSEFDVLALAAIFRAKYPSGTFLVSQISGTTTDGMLKKDFWDFINHPKSSGRWIP